VTSRHRVEDSEIKIGQSGQSEATVSSRAGGSLAEISEHPFLGLPGAQGLLVEYFDYQCASCRAMAGYLDALVARHGGIKVQLMPVPLEGSCNPRLGTNKSHAGSCEITRIALAVWRRSPDSFAVFHKKLFADPSVETARALALGIMTQAQLAEALDDPWITQSIESNIAAWRKLSKTSEKLPKLVINGRRVLHGLPASEAEFMHAMRAEWGFD
jgi:protein-disulfide isomerase